MKSMKRLTFLVAMMFVLATGSIAAYQSTPKTIALIDNGKVTQFESSAVYVKELLAAKGIVLKTQDEVTPSLDTKLENGMKVTITRWKQPVDFIFNGEKLRIVTSAETVVELLEQGGFSIEGDFEVTPSLDTVLTAEMVVEVKTREILKETVIEEIPFEQEVQYTSELTPGETQVITEGQVGTKHKIVEIVRMGGEVEQQTVQKELVVKEPVTEVVLVGEEKVIQKNVVVDAYSGKKYTYSKSMTMNASAYYHGPNDRWYNKTASGLPTFVGMVAVDKTVIPLGTVLYVEGYGIAVAGDTGGAIKGNKIDLYHNSYNEAIAYGRKNTTVYILEDQKINVRQERASVY